MTPHTETTEATAQAEAAAPVARGYVSAEETAALLAAGLTADVVHTQSFGKFSLTVRHVSDPENHKDGTLYCAELDGHEPDEISLTFQHQNPFEDGPNGWTNEALLAVLIHRLGTLDKELPSAENQTALHHLRHANMALQARSIDRAARGVEGTQDE